MSESIRCECGCGREANQAIVGYARSRFRGVGLDGARFSILCATGGDEKIAAMNDRIRARRSQATEPKFYGTQPSTLPETLPAGLVIKVAGVVIRLLEPARLIARGCAYDCPARAVKCEGDKAEEVLSRSDGVVIPLGWLDWATVPIQKAKPAMMGRCIEVFSPSASCELSPGHAGPHHCGNLRWVTALEQEANPASVLDLRTVDVFLKHLVANPLAFEPATCRDCSAPATHGAHCVYCANRCGSNGTPRRLTAPQLLARQEAMERRLRVEAREKPRPTKESKMLALPHPWECDDV